MTKHVHVLGPAGALKRVQASPGGLVSIVSPFATPQEPQEPQERFNQRFPSSLTTAIIMATDNKGMCRDKISL